MNGTIAYILAKKLALSIASGINNIELNGNTLVFQLKDGTSQSMQIPLPKDGEIGPKGENGAPGKDGAPGPQGEPGAKGDDGFSPTVTITPIDGGHRVTVTDATGTNSFDVMDGQDAIGGTTNPTWVGYTHQQAQLSGNLVDVVSTVDNDKCSVVPEIGSYGLVIAEGADETQRYVMYCQAVAPSPGHEIEGTTTIRIKYALPVSGGGTVDLSDYYTKSEVDSKINPTWIAYSPEEYVLGSVNDTYAMWLDNSRFSTPAAVGSYGLVIAKGQAGTDGTEAKNWIFVGEVLLPNSPIEGKTFVQVKFPLQIGSGEVANELITIKDTVVTNISQLPEEPCCIHAINSEIGFALKDDIVYVKPLGSVVEIYTIDGSIATVNVDPDTGTLTTGGPVENWAKESDVYNKEQVDNKIANISLTPGPAGSDGVTPHIGENGNWFIGDTDTEITARGENGLSALILNATFTTTPVVENDYLINRTWLNREPIKGEVISGTIKDDKDVVFWVVGKVIRADASPYTADFSQITKITGPQGQKGKDGTKGATFTPSIDADGNLSWSNDSGLNNPDSINIMGPAGQDGSQGISIESADFNEFNHLILTLSDGSTIDAGKIIIENAEIINQQYISADIKNSNFIFDGVNQTFEMPINDKTAAIYINGVRQINNKDYTIDDSVQPYTITFNLIYEESDSGYIEWIDKGNEEDLWATEDDINNLFT